MEYKDKQITTVESFCASNIIDDTKRSEGLETPDDIERFDNILYGDDKDVNLLDVYRLKNSKGKLPVIVSIHGGGWVYGNKDIMQFYCMGLAQKGFAVINFSYRLAPKYKHPTPFIDANKVFDWLLTNADKYNFDTKNVFAVGDSVGANILGLYCCACDDKEYAKKLSIQPHLKPRAVGLNCGIYRMAHGEIDVLLDSFAREYFPNRGTDEDYEGITVGNFVSKNFPASFVMTGEGDFLAGQAIPFFNILRSKGVEAEYHYYGDKEHELKHVFHVDIKLPEARQCNQDECEFFLKHIEKDTKGDSYDTLWKNDKRFDLWCLWRRNTSIASAL